MATEVRFRGGTAAQHASFVGAPREVTVDTTNWKLRIHDGSTPGGHEIGGGGEVGVSSPEGRLSLTAGVAITTSDVAGSPSLFYVPAIGNKAPIFDGTSMQTRSIGDGLTLALNSNSGHAGYHQADRNFDAFVLVSAGDVRLGTGPAWNAGAVAGSNTARGTGAGSTELELYDGVWVNKNSIAIRFGTGSGDTVVVPARQATFVGSIRTTANGQVDDTRADRFVFNAYNRVLRELFQNDGTASWNYSTAAWRQVRATTSNRVRVLAGLAGVAIDLTIQGRVITSAGTWASVLVAIGVDSTTVASGIYAPAYAFNTLYAHPRGQINGPVSLGMHAFNMLEFGTGADTQIWYGGTQASGLTGWVEL